MEYAEMPSREQVKAHPNLKNENYCKLKYPDFTDYIAKLYPECSHVERLYRFFYPDYNNICATCGNPTKFINFNKGYNIYCSPGCVSKNKNIKDKKKATTMEHYGVENPSQCKEIQDKKIETNLKKYGKQYYNNRDKAKQTCLERYGDPNYNNPDKVKQTCLKKYGVEYYSKTNEYIERTNKTFQEKYGGRANASKLTTIKSKQTRLERYGDPNYNNREKAINTLIEKYGTPFYPRVKKEKPRKKTKSPEEKKINKDNSRIRVSKKAMKYDNNILDVFLKDDILYYKCKCPHPECNGCIDKTYIVKSGIYSNRRGCNIEQCTNLMPVQTDRIKDTTIELYIKSILDKYNISYISNVRKIISPREVDIFIPDKNIAIECNGIYWHSHKNCDKCKHFEKYIECEKNGIQLITLWEDQIKKYPDKIESILLSKLGIYKNKIFARNCYVKEIDTKLCNEFIEKYHLLGKVNASIKLGLFNKDDELLSVMTFGKGRKCMNSKISYELYRYCCKNDTIIIGGASKLFTYFIRKYNPDKIESFSSNDISNGNLYKQLGFTYISSSIGYWYIGPDMSRYHRYKFTKHNLIKEGFDPNKSESDIMNERGFYKIYDSGQSKWLWDKDRI